MNLQEFVQDVLINLDQAIDGARKQTQRDIRFTQTADQRTVEFDIAVSAEDGLATKGKAGIRVLEFVEVGGDVSTENKNATVSRIKFGVHVDSMTRMEEAAITTRNNRNQISEDWAS